MIVTLADKLILVTGAGGFIGSHLTERLLRDGARVRAFVRYNSRGQEGFLASLSVADQTRLEIVYGDLRELDSVQHALAQVEVVFHLGALVGIPYSYIHTQEVIDTNIVGTANILMAAREQKSLTRVVLTSTSEVYGTAQYVPIDETHPLQAQSPYAATKIAADALGISFQRSFGLPLTIVRPFNAFGPRQSMRAVIPTIIVQALTREHVMLGTLTSTRDFTYVTDTVEGFMRAASTPGAIGRTINVGSGHEISIGELARRIVQLTGRAVPIVQDPRRLRPASSEVERLYAGNALAREVLGWQPQVSLDDGLRRTIDWIRGALELYRPDEYAV
jgi:NAD dependent epimerase/dehydratase